MLCAMCLGGSFSELARFNSPPDGETKYEFTRPYFRRVLLCNTCRHCTNVHSLLDSDFYSSGNYAKTTYKSLDDLYNKYVKIVALPRERSDNLQRVEYVQEFLRRHSIPHPVLLDVGAGLGVFPMAMKQLGWTCTALDLDHMTVQHLNLIGLTAWQSTLPDPTLPPLPIAGNVLITFNHVLEHLKNPVALLHPARKLLLPNGYVYIEVPDGEWIVNTQRENRKERNEFNVEHYHIFSMASLSLLISQAGFLVKQMERTLTPSGKCLLRAFACSA
jgi:hypothetical protein